MLADQTELGQSGLRIAMMLSKLVCTKGRGPGLAERVTRRG